MAVSQREIPEEEVQRFAECYVPASIVAKRFNLSSCSFARYLRQSGTPLLRCRYLMRGRVMRCFSEEISRWNFGFRR